MKRFCTVIFLMLLPLFVHAADDGIIQIFSGTSTAQMTALYVDGDAAATYPYNSLETGDIYFVRNPANNELVPYSYDSASAQAEDGERYFAPDNQSSGVPYAGNGRWCKLTLNIQDLGAYGVLLRVLVTAASTSGGAGIRITPGEPPEAPQNGDVWATSSGLYVHINGTTVGPLVDSASAGGAPISAAYLTIQAEPGLSNETNLGALTTGLLRIAVSGGVATVSIAIAGTHYLLPNGSGAALTGITAAQTGALPATLRLFQPVTVQSPTAAHDFPLFQVPAAYTNGITIQAVHYLAIGGTSWTGQLQEADSNGANGADTQAADTTASTGTGTITTNFSNASVDAGDWVNLKTTSVAGEVLFITVQIDYTIN